MSEFDAPWSLPGVIRHSQYLCKSFQHWTGRPLISLKDEENLARSLFLAPFAVLSHGTQADPILNYGNKIALELWQMHWQDFTQMPSRLTAEPMQRAERDRLLAQAATQGYISGYRGVRIARSGKRFWIENALIWDVLDAHGKKIGQAATFDSWQGLEDS